MKKTTWKKTWALAAITCMAWGLTATTSHASTVTASASMQWDSLALTGSGSAAVYSGIDSYSWSRAGSFDQWDIPAGQYDPAPFGSDFKSGIRNTLAASANYAQTLSQAETDTVPGQLNMTATASAQALSYLDEYSAIAVAQRGEYYQVTGSGNITFSVDYLLDAILMQDADDGGAWAEIMAWSFLRRWNGETETWEDMIPNNDGFRIAEINTGLIQDPYFYRSPSNIHTLSFTYAATEGEYLHFGSGVTSKVSAINSNAVPIPGAVWLLGSGMAGLIAIRRKSAS